MASLAAMGLDISALQQVTAPTQSIENTDVDQTLTNIEEMVGFKITDDVARVWLARANKHPDEASIRRHYTNAMNLEIQDWQYAVSLKPHMLMFQTGRAMLNKLNVKARRNGKVEVSLRNGKRRHRELETEDEAFVPDGDCSICARSLSRGTLHTLACCDQSMHNTCYRRLLNNAGRDARCPLCRACLTCDGGECSACVECHLHNGHTGTCRAGIAPNVLAESVAIAARRSISPGSDSSAVAAMRGMRMS